MSLKVFNPDNNSEVPLAQAKPLNEVWIIVDYDAPTVYGAWLSKEDAQKVYERLILDFQIERSAYVTSLKLVGGTANVFSSDSD